MLKCVTGLPSFFKLSDISLSYIPNLFIHSSLDGHMDRFCLPAIVNSAIMNMGLAC